MSEIYNRKAIFEKLKEYCYFAKEDDFIEITEWVNHEGYDIEISKERESKRISLTSGEIKAIKKLIKKFEKEE